MLIKDRLEDIELNLNFEYKINILLDNSGTGKTYLMTILSNYFMKKGLTVKLINYTNYYGNSIYKDIKDGMDCDILFLDNADLYMNNEIFKEIIKSRGIVIVSLKDRFMLADIDNKLYGFYRINISNNTISSIKRR